MISVVSETFLRARDSYAGEREILPSERLRKSSREEDLRRPSESPTVPPSPFTVTGARARPVRVCQPCQRSLYCTYFPATAAEHGCCAAAAASRRRELRLMTDVAESCAPFPLQLHHAHLQLHLLPLPLSLTDTDSTTVLDAHVFSPLHEFGASCPLPKTTTGRVRMCEIFRKI